MELENGAAQNEAVAEGPAQGRAVDASIAGFGQTTRRIPSIVIGLAEAIKNAVARAICAEFEHCSPVVGAPVRCRAIERPVSPLEKPCRRILTVILTRGKAVQDAIAAPVLAELEYRS